jgi:hypothetical protein
MLKQEWVRREGRADANRSRFSTSAPQETTTTMTMLHSYNATKLKSQLKMAATRFSIAASKKSALSRQRTCESAGLLTEVTPRKDEEKARIVAEALIRDDDAIDAYGMLELNCKLLSERVHLITHGGGGLPPPDLAGCVLTLIWASEAVDPLPELAKVWKQFLYRYGREFEEAALRNAGGGREQAGDIEVGGPDPLCAPRAGVLGNDRRRVRGGMEAEGPA